MSSGTSSVANTTTFQTDPGIAALTRAVGTRFRCTPHPVQPTSLIFYKDFVGDHEERMRTPVNMHVSALVRFEVRGHAAIVVNV